MEELPWEMVEEITQYLDAVDINNLCRANKKMAQRMCQTGCRTKLIDMDQIRNEKPDVAAIYEIAKYCANIDTVAINFKHVRGKISKLGTIQSHGGIARLAKKAGLQLTEVQGIWQTMDRNYMNDGQDHYLKALERCFGEKIKKLTLRNFVYGSEAQCGINRMWKNVTTLEISMDHTTWIDRCRTRHFFAKLWSLKEIKIVNMVDLHQGSNILTNVGVNSVEKIVFKAKTAPEWHEVMERQQKLKYLECTMGREGGRLKLAALEEAIITIPRHDSYIGFTSNGDYGAIELFKGTVMKKLTVRADGPDLIKNILRGANKTSSVKELIIIEEHRGSYAENALRREARQMLNEFELIQMKSYTTSRTQ